MSEAVPKLQGKAAEYARILRDHLPELRERYGVQSLGIFGSYVRGEEREDSDLDLLVEFSRPTGLLRFAAFRRYASELLGIEVDLVSRRGLNRRVGQRILKEVMPVEPNLL